MTPSPSPCAACGERAAVVVELGVAVCSPCREIARRALLGPARAGFDESRPTLDNCEQLARGSGPVEAR